jgi:hypothetical protein
MDNFSTIQIILYLIFIYFVLKKTKLIGSMPFMSVMLYFGILFIYNPIIAYLLGIPIILANLSPYVESFNSEIDTGYLLQDIINSVKQTKNNSDTFNKLRDLNMIHTEYLKKNMDNKNKTFKEWIENDDDQDKITYQLYDYSLKNLPKSEYTKLNNKKYHYQQTGEKLKNTEKLYKKNVNYQNNRIEINNDLIQKVEENIKHMSNNLDPKFQLLKKEFEKSFLEFQEKLPERTHFPLN